MTFTSIDYLLFFAIVYALYWAIRVKSVQNAMLLAASYVFYGYVHPWFCILIVLSTLLDYVCGLGMERRPRWRRGFMWASLAGNLGMLGVFKYFNFFADNVHHLLTSIGFSPDPIALRIYLPVGISFYTFQTLSYTIDIYRGDMKPRTNLLDFALFVSFFPQLVAGPIERAQRLLPQIETPRRWNWDYFHSAWPLLVRGYLKKMMIADNAAVLVNKVYMLEHPTVFLLVAGTLAFALQILADFSAYTDIARGSSRLLGIDLMENFKSPYLAVSPSDFWRRWHISFSTWIRDYLYIPLGGSRVSGPWRFALVMTVTMGLSGLWHGAAWNFVLWGIFYGVLAYGYHAAGFSGRWKPATRAGWLGAWALMFFFTLVGWMLFRTTSMAWLLRCMVFDPRLGLSGDSLIAGAAILGLLLLYSMPMYAMLALDRLAPNRRWLHTLFHGAAVALIIVFFRDGQQDFIYFQF